MYSTKEIVVLALVLALPSATSATLNHGPMVGLVAAVLSVLPVAVVTARRRMTHRDSVTVTHSRTETLSATPRAA